MFSPISHAYQQLKQWIRPEEDKSMTSPCRKEQASHRSISADWTSVKPLPTSSIKEFFSSEHRDVPLDLPASPTVINLYVERKALESFRGPPPNHCFRYVDDTWVELKTQEVE